MRWATYLLFLLTLVLRNSPAWAEESAQPPEDQPNKVTTGIFTEGNTKRYDYTLLYTAIEFDAAGVPVRVQIDRFLTPSPLNRVWLNVEKFEVVDNGHVQVTLSPGLLVTDASYGYVGGFIDVALKDWDIFLSQKSYIGNRADKHITFVTWQPHENLGLMYYRYAERRYVPDSYLGPVLSVGSIFGWAGLSVNRPGAWAVNVQASWDF